LLALLALAVAPFLSPVEREDGRPRAPQAHSSEVEGLESIRGFMSLAEVEKATGVPAAHIIDELGLPSGVEHGERLGRLKTAYGFTLDDVRRVVQVYQQGEAQPSRQR
jgi:hypothetical protein